MSRVPSYEYELLHQFEVIFRDGEHKTQAATRDYQKVWENVIDDPPDLCVTPVLVYRMNGAVCAAVAGLDDLIDNQECAMEIARLAAENERLTKELAEASEAIRNAHEFASHATLDSLIDHFITWEQRPAVRRALEGK